MYLIINMQYEVNIIPDGILVNTTAVSIVRHNWQNQTDNLTEVYEVQRTFGIRFLPYTILLVGSVTFNLISLTAMTKIRGHRTVHHTLLLNLAACDLSGSMLLWMYYNSPFIFSHLPRNGSIEYCLFIVLVLAGSFILSLCCCSLSLLSLALNQYIAICAPLFSTTTITKRKALCCIMFVWILSITCAMVPALLMLVGTQISMFEHCAHYAATMSVKSLEVCTYIMATLIIIIIALYARIYREIVRYRQRTPQLTQRRFRSDEAEHNYKAFITTLLLSGSLVVFWLPYMGFHFISAHIDIEAIPDTVLYMKFYVIDFMPMLSFLTDPIIYGIRMREVRDAYHRLFAKLLPCCISPPSRVIVRGSIRFTTLDTTTV